MIFFVGSTNDAQKLLEKIHQWAPLDDKPLIETMLSEARHTPAMIKDLLRQLPEDVVGYDHNLP